ncbi:MAG: hypothetical protein QOJ09_1154 [Actinomycetota bacterium]|nr:hypothetical protein [Actinomycetota bacterium]
MDRPSPATSRLLRGYGPLLAAALLFLLMATFVPTVDREVVTASGSNGALAPGQTGGADVLGDSTSAGGTAGAGGGGGGTAAGKGALPPGVKGGCPDRQKQVPNDPYSPPCVTFTGSNGGATSKGVTADKIVIAARVLNEPGFQQALADVAGAQISDTPDDVKRTVLGMADYFNKHFQLYGRKLDIRFYDGKGSSTTELLGGGQEEAEADATSVAEEIKAFADMTAATVPYHDALTRRKVVAFGAPYTSREWMTARRPYSWSIATDCSIVTESVAEFTVKRLAKRKAEFAGPAMQQQTRRFALLSPENPWYQECVDAGTKIATQAGSPPADRIKYKLDLGSMSNQATNVIAKLKSEGITSVVCGCDPVFPIFLTQKAQEQGYEPEWIVTGTALTDQDIVGQLYDQNQWKRAFGISYLGSPQPLRGSDGYFAYKSVRSDEPAFIVDIIYYQMYMIALGVQLAGPDLTPQTFERGMFSYPGGAGRVGTWGFGPGHYTPTQDFREIWWNGEATSSQNGKQGAYIEVDGGKRWKPGTLPNSDPKIFGK